MHIEIFYYRSVIIDKTWKRQRRKNIVHNGVRMYSVQSDKCGNRPVSSREFPNESTVRVEIKIVDGMAGFCRLSVHPWAIPLSPVCNLMIISQMREPIKHTGARRASRNRSSRDACSDVICYVHNVLYTGLRVKKHIFPDDLSSFG